MFRPFAAAMRVKGRAEVQGGTRLQVGGDDGSQQLATVRRNEMKESEGHAA
jgi:hypothetical protein